jgi:hypothetical protein
MNDKSVETYICHLRRGKRQAHWFCGTVPHGSGTYVKKNMVVALK